MGLPVHSILKFSRQKIQGEYGHEVEINRDVTGEIKNGRSNDCRGVGMIKFWKEVLVLIRIPTSMDTN